MVHWLAWPGLAWSCLFLSCLAAPPSSPFPALRHPPMDDENRFSLPSGCHTTRDGPHGSPISAVGWSELRGAHGWADGRVVCLCIAGETGPRGGGRDALGIVIVSYVSCAGQQTTIDHGSSATDDWRRHQEPRTNRQASKRSVLAGERRRRQRDMVSLNAVGSALAHIPRFGIRIPEQAWLSAAGVRILSQAKPASVSQSASRDGEERTPSPKRRPPK